MIKGKLVKIGWAEHDDRYYTYVNWDFYHSSGFLRIPIGNWTWKPRFTWGKWERGVAFLWLFVRWSKSFRYVEREDWKIQVVK